MIEPVAHSDMKYPAPNLDYVNKIKMNNIKWGKGNLHVQVVREALNKAFPTICPAKPPVFDHQMLDAVRQYQYTLGEEPTGEFTREQLENLGKVSGFTVV